MSFISGIRFVMARAGRLIRRSARNDEGVAAIEFGLVAAPFFALLFVIIEMGLTYFAMSSLDTGLRSATRQLQIGKTMTAESFRTSLCNELPAYMKCDNVIVDVRRVSANTIKNVLYTTDDGRLGDLIRPSLKQDENAFCTGDRSDFMIARALYIIPTLFGFVITTKIESGGQSTYIVESARAYRNEPFAVKGVSC